MSNLFKNTFRYKKSDKYKMWRYLACFVGHIYPRDIENSLESIFSNYKLNHEKYFQTCSSTKKYYVHFANKNVS